MKQLILSLSIISLMASCIGNDYVDDRVDPILRITNPIDSIAIDSSYQFEYRYLNNVGSEEQVEAQWSTSDENILSINSNGMATAFNPGTAEISLEYQSGSITLSDSKTVGVGERTVITDTGASGVLKSTSSYKLTGTFSVSEDGADLVVAFDEDYEASTALPGLFVYLSNNPNTISDAHEIQAVEIFKGAHSYTIPNTAISDYQYVLYFCKPFNVKVGDGSY